MNEVSAVVVHTASLGRVGSGAAFAVRDLRTVEDLPEPCVKALRDLAWRGAFSDLAVEYVAPGLNPSQILVNLLLTAHGPEGITFVDPDDGWQPEDREALWVLLEWLGAVRP